MSMGERTGSTGCSPADAEAGQAQGSLQQEREKNVTAEKRVAMLEGEVRSAREGCVRLCEQLHAQQHSTPSAELLKTATLDEVIGMCEAAAKPLSNQAASSSAALSESEQRRQERSAPLVAAAGGLPVRDVSGRRRCCSCCYRCTRKKVALGSGLGLLALLLFVLLLVRVIVPAMAQHFLDSSTVTLISAKMMDPKATTIRMTANARVDNAGPVSAHIESFRAEMSADGIVFAWCTFPDVVTNADGPTDVLMDSDLHITNNAAFTKATASILQGKPGNWQLSGRPWVHAMGLTNQLRLSQTLHLPETVLEKVRSDKIDVLSSTATEVLATSETTFFSSSVLEMKDFGKAIFALHGHRPDGSVDLSMQLGKVTIPNFQVFRGYNALQKVSILMQKTDTSAPALSSFLGTWMSGTDQELSIRGPIESESPFLNNLTLQSVTIPGLANGGMIKSAYISGDHTVVGHVPQSGKPCPPTDGKHCLKGSVIVAGNPVGKWLRLRDMSMDVNLIKGIKYSAVIKALGIVPIKKFDCPRTTKLPRMFSTKGMWSYVDPKRSRQDWVDLAPGNLTVSTLASFFLAGKPQPGESSGPACLPEQIDPFDCCFTVLMSAVSCYYKAKGQSFVPASTSGQMTLEIGDFSLPVHVQQERFPINFAEDMAGLHVGPISMSCDDFTFHH